MKKIAFISGVFDGAHKGHLYILTEMRKLAPHTVVAINSDAYAARKGPGRPLVKLEDRRAALYASSLVDEVIAIEDSPLEVINLLKPDFICVGRADYKPEQVVGYKECPSWGGQIVIIPEDLGVSTTQMVKKGLMAKEWANKWDNPSEEIMQQAVVNERMGHLEVGNELNSFDWNQPIAKDSAS